MESQDNNSISFPLLDSLRICYQSFAYPTTETVRIFRNRSNIDWLPGAWPIIGHLHLLGGQTPLCEILASFSDSINSPIFRIRLGVKPMVVVSNRDLVRECFTTNNKALASHPWSKAGVYLDYNHAAFVFSPYGPLWREMRKMTMVELLGSRRLEILKHVRVEEVESFIEGLYEFWKNSGGSRPVQVVLSESIEHLSLNIILRMISGKRHFVGAEMGEETSNLRRVIKDFVYVTGLVAVSDYLPFMSWTDHVGTIRKMKEVARDWDCIVGMWVEEREDPVHGHTPETILKGEIVTGGASGLYLSPLQTTIIAGSDTTALNLTWTLSLNDVVGRERWVEVADLQNLPYLQSASLSSRRERIMFTLSAPLAVPHEAMEDCVVNGYLIQKGTPVFVNLWKLHRDPNIWSDPEAFKPERFMTTHSETDTTGQCHEYIPFGSGRRS
ncbi:hypothetical protein MLD38_025164 [Melastoma candidum]|uniref:Uncharacterized protein n=1 Tax=Melastoma candidum TaxID=119954 RepID=A0ACB9NY00_9MYRT|nr:hypothetical protein MLD38_025164 [Melastoma candidum]